MKHRPALELRFPVAQNNAGEARDRIGFASAICENEIPCKRTIYQHPAIS
jgi:hypothetical protein